MVRLPGASSDEGVAPLRERFTDQELELSQLVAATSQTHQVVALDVERRAVLSHNSLEPLQPLNGRGTLEQRVTGSSGKLIKHGSALQHIAPSAKRSDRR
jgi:hypothetical protein